MGRFIKTKNIAPYGTLEISVSDLQLAGNKRVYPGVRGKLKESIPGNVALLAGTPVIIQPLNRNKSRETAKFRITPYKNNNDTKKSDQPESHRDIITQASHIIALPHPERVLKFNNEHFRRSHDVLFPEADSPSPEEIKQCRIPDCFLLAALQTIMNHPEGKSFIRGMMRQNDDGTTTVRLYDPSTLKPVFITVENSIAIDRFGALNRHDALWVHILEKAYAALGKKEVNQQIKTVDSSISSVYSSGGQSKLALEIVTGFNTTFHRTDFSEKLLKIETFIGEHYPILKSLLDNPEISRSQLANFLLSSLDANHLTFIYKNFGATLEDDASELQALEQYVDLITLFNNNSSLFTQAVETHSIKNIEAVNPAAAAVLADFFIAPTAFSGQYNKKQLAIYENIKSSLANGQLVAAGTYDKLDKKIAVGLIGSHAYSVAGVVEKTMQIKNAAGEPQTIPVNFVKVRNPWGTMDGLMGTARDLLAGNVGRTYEQHNSNLDVVAEGGQEAEFLVELSDFCRYYDGYTITESADKIFQQTTMRENQVAEANEFIDNFSLDFTSSNEKLIEAHSQYEKHLANALGMELSKFKTCDLSELIRSQKMTSQPVLCDKLIQIKTALNIIVATRANSPEHNIDILNDLTSLIKNDLLHLRNLMNAPDQTSADNSAQIDGIIGKAISNFMKLEQLYHEFLQFEVVLKNFGYSSSNAEIFAQCGEDIEVLEKQMKLLMMAKPSFDELWILRDEILKDATNYEQQHKISPKLRADIQRAAQCLLSPNSGEIVKTLLNSNLEPLRNLGEKIVKAKSLSTKIRHLLTGIGIFLKKIAENLATFFHTRNAYELPAIAQKDAPTPKL